MYIYCFVKAILYLVSAVSGQTETRPVLVVAVGAVVTVAAQSAIRAPSALRTRIGAHVSL